MHHNTEDIVIVIIAGTLSILFLATILIVYIYAYQKRQNTFIEEKETLQKNFEEVLMQSQIEIQEATMSSLGRELHDNIGQILSSTKLLLGITQRNLQQVPETLYAADESLGKAITEIRSLSKLLDKDWLQKFNLLQNIQTEANRINSAQTVHIHLSHPGTISMPSEQQIILFRIIQESLQNAVKHADAANINVVIAGFDRRLSLTISDDGKGFDTTKYDEGMGLINMKQRVHWLGGEINWKSAPGKGCSVSISIPLKKPNT